MPFFQAKKGAASSPLFWVALIATANTAAAQSCSIPGFYSDPSYAQMYPTYVTPGSVVDVSTPNPYPINQQCYKVLQTVPGEKIQLSFQSFSTERNFDFLRLYNGNSPTPFFQTSGSDIPPTLVSDGNELYIEFNSDSSVVADGFVAEAETYYPPVCANGFVQTPGDTDCVCYPGWSGRLCDQEIPCVHGERQYYGSCVCEEGWIGPSCDEPFCLNNGTMQYYGSCVCAELFTGARCEEAVCVNGESHYYGSCICNHGWAGPHCNQIVCPPGLLMASSTSCITYAELLEVLQADTRRSCMSDLQNEQIYNLKQEIVQQQAEIDMLKARAGL